jgi:hypothetical protein
MTEDRVGAILDNLPPGVTEIYLHPAESGDFAAAAPDCRYAEELAALVSPRTKERLRRSGAASGGFGHFPG